MYNALLHAHSGLRYVAVILLLAAIINAARKMESGNYIKKDKMLNLFAIVFLHIQLLIGLGLFFINEHSKVVYAEGWISVPVYRFFGLEHLVGMLLAITIITLGRRKAESLKNTRDKHRRILFSYLIRLIVI